jgi:hypothetical protein
MEFRSEPSGRSHSVSYFRRLVIDLTHFSAKVPSVTIERRMDLAPLVAAREACVPPPSWSAIFTKAYAMVAARTAALRTSYMTFPWPRFYEHPGNIATLNIDRQLAGERVVLYVLVASPESRSLYEIDAVIRDHQEQPVDSLPSYRAAVRLSRVPWPVRRFIWWGGLNVFGALRCHHFGTFGFTSLGALGASLTHMVPLLTSTVHYGMFDTAGTLAMRLSFDHRVIDGATAAQALADMEEVLRGAIADECRGFTAQPADNTQKTEIPDERA